MRTQITKIVLKVLDPKNDKQFVSIDSHCGYPYMVADPTRAKFWESESEAFRYASMFPEEIELKIYILTAEVTEKPAPKDERPHSRACGIRKHDHGRECSSNCPTCGGKSIYA